MEVLRQNDLRMAVIAIMVLFVFCIVLFTFKMLMYRRSVNKLLMRTNNLKENIDLYKQRYNKLTPHLQDYFNSLEKDGKDNFKNIQFLFQAIEDRVQEIEKMLQYDKYLDAYNLVNQPLEVDPSYVSFGMVRNEISIEEWSNRVEESLQHAGIALAKISSNNKTPLPKYKHRTRKPTKLSLIDAGIKNID